MPCVDTISQMHESDASADFATLNRIGDEILAAPIVSIVIPVFNDEEHLGAAIDSCLAQTLADIEVIVVDDASTDGTVQLVERYMESDRRVRLIRQETNQTAFQARRVGIDAATSEHVLFLDGDDELQPEAAERTLDLATSESADIVAFGCVVVKPDGKTGGAFEKSMQPHHARLDGDAILQTLFPIGESAQGQLWRYLFKRELLTSAYDSIESSSTLALRRANDLPIAFLAIMAARKYVSTTERLYRYYFRRGASGHRIASIEQYEFHAVAIDSIEAIAPAVERRAGRGKNPGTLLATYQSARLSIVGRVLGYATDIVDHELREQALSQLIDRVGQVDAVLAAADFSSRSLPHLVKISQRPALGARPPRHVLIRATNLGTGGAQGVVVAQAKLLREAGFTVTIGIDAVPDTNFRLPDGVTVVRFAGATFSQRIRMFVDFCHDHAVDVVVDHYVFYNERWPYYALAAAAASIPTIGWLHNFALRPLVDGSDRLSYLEATLPILAATVVLSETDAAYWRYRGLTEVVYLPNPPSPLLEHLTPHRDPRAAPDGVLEIVWWGRLQQSTKQVRELIEIASELDNLDVAYNLTIVGPDGPDLKASDLRKLASMRGIRGGLALPGALHGDELDAAIAHAHVFVSTSLIEGYPLVFMEAQALGLPLVAYEMAWLEIVKNNGGITSVGSGDRYAAARALATLARDPDVYRAASLASLAAADAARDHDFAAMYTDLVEGKLNDLQPSEDTAEHVSLLLRMHAQYHERLILRQRRELTRLRSEVGELKAQLKGNTSKFRRRRVDVSSLTPSVARSGWRGILQKIVPPSMYQASFYARHQHRVSTEILAQLTDNQASLARQLAHIEKVLSDGEVRKQQSAEQNGMQQSS